MCALERKRRVSICEWPFHFSIVIHSHFWSPVKKEQCRATGDISFTLLGNFIPSTALYRTSLFLFPVHSKSLLTCSLSTSLFVSSHVLSPSRSLIIYLHSRHSSSPINICMSICGGIFSFVCFTARWAWWSSERREKAKKKGLLFRLAELNETVESGRGIGKLQSRWKVAVF